MLFSIVLKLNMMDATSVDNTSLTRLCCLLTTKNIGYIRFGVLSASVGPGAYEDDGYDITSSYETFITLNFLILVESCGVDLTIDPETNQIGLFTTHANSDGSGDIHNQTLSSPININDACLPD